jgi:prepilin-type N-terminal cleavage/methylation domain-containing protein/prepilin-type processing-associated H-X9-DG protein
MKAFLPFFIQRPAGKTAQAKDEIFAGFTLIELLVVIAIIAILASMLLPALKRTRDTAKQIKCTGNIKQCSMACFEYINDYNGFIPYAYVAGGGYSGYGDSTTGTWYVKVAPYLNIPYYSHGAIGVSYSDYIKGPCIFTCPSQNFVYEPAVKPVSYAPSIRTANAATIIFPSPETRQGKLKDVKKVSEKVLISDSGSQAAMNPWQIEPTGNHYDAFNRHRKGGNGAFFDGHVELILYKDARTPFVSGGLFDPFK